MHNQDVSLFRKINWLSLRLVPLTSYRQQDETLILVSNLTKGTPASDEQEARLYELLLEENIIFTLHDGKLTICDPASRAVIRQVMDEQEFKSESLRQVTPDEGIALLGRAGHWEAVEGKPGELCIDVGALTMPIHEFVHYLHQVDVDYSHVRRGKTNFIQIHDKDIVFRIIRARDQIFTQIASACSDMFKHMEAITTLAKLHNGETDSETPSSPGDISSKAV